MSSTPKTKEIFLAALGMPAGDRVAYLESTCQDPKMRREVDGLLAAFSRAGQFLEPARRLGAPGSTDLYRQTPGGATRTVGRYRILERLGEGGFGVVYRAEQTEPVHRYAALKIVKLGMDTEEVLKRFDAERQTLALMDHANIATVFDGGVTDGGRPYFVMELAIGQPITDYCDGRSLGIPERLRLFVSVCRGVQHAHSKGIVHRDLKPGNVLVATRDGLPAPKIIDFGIAKALAPGAQEPDDSKITMRGAFLGTPQYMSPEQTRADSNAIDTRSDVYALGCVLYELLTSTPPLTPAMIRGKDLGELLTLIRSTDAPAPAVRLGELEPKAMEAAAQSRGTEPRRLSRALRGELDWIVRKALAKDPDQRYATADALANDLERHLTDQPVLAGPPSWSYQVGKLARKHKVWVSGVAAGLVALTIGAAALAALWLESRATQRELRQALQQTREALMECDKRREEASGGELRKGEPQKPSAVGTAK